MNSSVLKKEITRDELKAIVRELVEEILWEYEQRLPDPDEGLEFRPEVVERLQGYLKARSAGRPLDEAVQELGLDDE